jgi:hypothetical protein
LTQTTPTTSTSIHRAGIIFEKLDAIPTPHTNQDTTLQPWKLYIIQKNIILFVSRYVHPNDIPIIPWEILDPKMEVLYHIKPDSGAYPLT